MKKTVILACIFLIINSLCVIAGFEDYPQNIIKNNTLDAVLVIGDNAAAEDVLGAIEIGMGLQYAVGEKTSVVLDDAIRKIQGGFKFDKTGNHFTGLLDSLYDIQNTLGDDELPVILATELYVDEEGETGNKEKYDQTIAFKDHGDNTVVKRYQPDGRDAGSYMKIYDDNATYTYTLDFDNPISYTNTSISGQRPSDDLEDTIIKIQGKEYTITGVTDKGASGAYSLDRITLMAGDTLVWIQQGKTMISTIEEAEHEIEVSDVNDNEDMCGVSVDGDMVWIKKGQTRTINGISIGVSDAVAVHAQMQDVDICRLNLGASEIELRDGDEVRINGNEIDNSVVYLRGTPGEWDGFNISYGPTSDIYLTTGDEFLDGVFGNFKLVFGGINEDSESFNIETTGDDNAELVFTNNDRKQVTIPMFFNGTNVMLGEDDDDRLLQEGGLCNKTTVQDCEGTLLYAVTSGGEAHILKVIDINVNRNEIDLEDLTYDKKYSNRKYTDSHLASEFVLGSIGVINFMVNESLGILNMTDINKGTAETIGGGIFDFHESGVNVSVHFLEEAHDETSDYRTNISLQVVPDTTDDEIDIAKPTDELLLYRNTINGLLAPGGTCQLAGWNEAVCSAQMCAGTFGAAAKALCLGRSMFTGGEGWLDVTEGNSDIKYSSTLKSMVLWDKKDKSFASLSYSDYEPTIDFYIAPADSELKLIQEMDTIVLNEIGVGSAKLASEVAGQEKEMNMIAIGGPCSNPASTALMGLEFPTCNAASTIKEGTGILRMYNNDNHIGIVAAGFDAMGTRAASRVLADYMDHGLSGKDIEISYTSLDDVSAGEPSEAEEIAVEEEPVQVMCKGTNPADSISSVIIKKYGIKIESDTEITIRMSGNSGVIKFVPERVFEAQLGVDWLERTVRIFKGDCDARGEQVFFDTVRWIDGERTKLVDIDVPGPGCYCLYADNSDISIDDASIEFKNGFSMTDFST